jgi:hypothetical protein
MRTVDVVSTTTNTDDEPYTTENLATVRGKYREISEVTELLSVDFNDLQVYIIFEEHLSLKVQGDYFSQIAL